MNTISRATAALLHGQHFLQAKHRDWALFHAIDCKNRTIGRDDANGEGKEPLYRVYKVGPVKLYTVESILRLLLRILGSGSADLEGIRRNVWRPITSHSDSEG